MTFQAMLQAALLRHRLTHLLCCFPSIGFVMFAPCSADQTFSGQERRQGSYVDILENHRAAIRVAHARIMQDTAKLGVATATLHDIYQMLPPSYTAWISHQQSSDPVVSWCPNIRSPLFGSPCHCSKFCSMLESTLGLPIYVKATSSVRMLRIWMASGELLASIAASEPRSVRSLKQDSYSADTAYGFG